MATQESSSDETLDDQAEAPGRQTALRHLSAGIGVVLILLSGVFFASLFAVPFLPLGAGAKVLMGGALYAGMQIAWWAGVAFAGSSAIGKMKSWFRRPVDS